MRWKSAQRTIPPIILLALLLYTPVGTVSGKVTSFPPDYEGDYVPDVEGPTWKTRVDGKWLDWGETRTVGNRDTGVYTVEVSDFDVDEQRRYVRAVLVRIYDTGTDELLAQGLYRDGGENLTIVSKDEVRVNVTGVRDAEAGVAGTEHERKNVRAQARITVDTRALPRPSVTGIDLSKDGSWKIEEMHSSEEFWAKFRFENEGGAELYGPSFEANVSGFKLLEVRDENGKLQRDEYSVRDGTVRVSPENGGENASLDPGETYDLKLRLGSPNVLNERDLSVTAEVKGLDLKGGVYTASARDEVRVFSLIYVYKSLSPDRNRTTDEFDAYLGDEARVEIYVQNMAETPVEIEKLRDPVPRGFSVLANQSTVWRNVEVGGRSTKKFAYTVKPRKTGWFRIAPPHASFRWEGVGNASTEVNVEKVLVSDWGRTHGPLVGLRKDVSPRRLRSGETGVVRLLLINEGDRSAKVELTEHLPSYLSIEGETPGFTEVLQPGEVVEAEYRFEAKRTGSFTLPAAEAVYEDIVGRKWMTLSSRPELTVVGLEGRGEAEVERAEGPKTKNEGGGGTPVSPGAGLSALISLAAASTASRFYP